MPDRRTVLTSAAAGVAAAGAALAGTTARAGVRTTSGTAASATVDMELLLLAAQWDIYKKGTAITPGAGPSVLAVERALADHGLLARTYVDGHFGTSTVAAYSAYQRSIGHTGEWDTNGIPDPDSLRRLGAGRFTVVRPVHIGRRVRHQGFPFNARTRDMILEAQRRCGFRLPIEQGSYSKGVDPTSAGSHDGGGAVDVHAPRMTPAQRTAVCRALREVGFAAWIRNPSQADWPWHIHGIAVLDTDLSPLAHKQVGKYYEGYDGLSHDRPDDGPRVRKVTWEEYRRAHPG